MRTLSAILATAALVTLSQSAHATSAPAAGTYAATILVGQVKGSGCLDSSGSQFAGVVNYDGISGTTIGLRIPTIYNGSPLISAQRLSVKSGIGSTQPSGSFHWTGTDFNARQWDFTGSFSASIGEIDGLSFLVLATESYSGCTENLAIGLTRVGATEH